jgi:antitoxin ParD1/3/4
MSRLSIELPDDLKAQAETRAVEAGYSSVEAYVQNLLRADLETGASGAPARQTYHDEQQLESLLRAGVDSGSARELHDVDWNRKRAALMDRGNRPASP